jgi:hypothetical protein
VLRTRHDKSANLGLGLMALMLAGGCVFPADEPTGIELSWRFVEINTVDLDDENMTRTVRTCAGAEVDQVFISLVDTDDETRRGTFHYPCDEGFQTVSEFQTQSSDAFVELRPGKYAADVRILDTMGRTEATLTRDIDVLSRTLTIEGFELAREPAALRLRLQGAASCGELALHLRYADPGVQLGEPPLDDDGEPIPVVYRQGLASDRDLSLGGTTIPCSADLDGLHVFVDVDPGAYTLEVHQDGAVCPFGVRIDREAAELPVDLANLPCDG